MNALCWAIVLCVEKVEKLVSIDYTVPRTRAALIRTYGTVNDRRRLLSSARETTAMFPEVLSAVINVTTATSSATLAEFCCKRLVWHTNLLMWLAHFCCSQATWKRSVQAPEKSTLRCCVSIKLPQWCRCLPRFSC